jgi:hypothetical protein
LIDASKIRISKKLGCIPNSLEIKIYQGLFWALFNEKSFEILLTIPHLF